jgi:4'-phosphopantetheinyl transferase
MTSGQARAYYCDTRSLDEACVKALRGLLSDEERRRQDRFSLARDRRDYAAAHALLRIALASGARTSPERLSFAADPLGRPFLLPAGETARPPSFSLAHSRGLVACAIAPAGAIGIDVEEVSACARPVEIASRFFSEDEAAALKSGSTAERKSRFCELWVLKEALLKATGAGLACPLDQISFCLRGGRVRLARVPPFLADRWRFLLRDVKETHKLAIAATGRSTQGPRIGLAAVDASALADAVLSFTG